MNPSLTPLRQTGSRPAAQPAPAPASSGEAHTRDAVSSTPDTPDQAGASISLKDVHKVYTLRDGTEVRALNGLSLEVPAGAIHGIVGSSGAGKSTLVRCLTALERPTSGEVRVAGQDLTALSPAQLREARRKIGMVFQHANLLDSRTTAQNVAYPLALAGVRKGHRHEAVSRMLDLVGLADRGSSYPAQLSGGQKQRVGIARALADHPDVLLCDEPTSALDPETTRQILELIRDVRDRLGVTVVIITHEMGVVRQVCDSVSLLEAGQVVETGTVEEIISRPSSRLAQELVPLPEVPAEARREGEVLIDVALTAHPGQPAAAAIMTLAKDYDADVSAGVFQTLGSAQIGRLALAVPQERAEAALAALTGAGALAEVRA